jgi:hypothetical protein
MGECLEPGEMFRRLYQNTHKPHLDINPNSRDLKYNLMAYEIMTPKQIIMCEERDSDLVL